MWLIRDLRDFDPNWKLGGDRLHRLLEVLAERQNVAAILHRDAKAERRTAALAHHESRRVLVAPFDRRDVTEPEYPAVNLHRDGGDRLGARKGAGHAKMDAVSRGIDRPAGNDGVLPRHAIEDLLRRDA